MVLGLDNNLVQAAEKTGLFVPSEVDTQSLTVPGGWQNKTFVPYDYGYFAFVYNKNTLKNPPTSLKQLVDGPEKWKVIYQDPRTSTPGLGLMLWMQKVYGNDAPQAWQKLAKKTVTVTKGWSEAYGLFLKGEADLVLSYTTSPAYHIIEEKKITTQPPNLAKVTIYRWKLQLSSPVASSHSWHRNLCSLLPLRLSRTKCQPATGCIR